MAPDGELAGTIEAMRDIMVRAGAAVSGGLPITASLAATVTSNRNFGDTPRGRQQGL